MLFCVFTEKALALFKFLIIAANHERNFLGCDFACFTDQEWIFGSKTSIKYQNFLIIF
jgi:hypothetical protein